MKHCARFFFEGWQWQDKDKKTVFSAYMHLWDRWAFELSSLCNVEAKGRIWECVRARERKENINSRCARGGGFCAYVCIVIQSTASRAACDVVLFIYLFSCTAQSSRTCFHD